VARKFQKAPAPVNRDAPGAMPNFLRWSSHHVEFTVPSARERSVQAQSAGAPRAKVELPECGLHAAPELGDSGEPG